MEDDRQNFSGWFYYQALFSNSSDCFQGAKLTAQCVYTFFQQLFIHQCHGKMSFSQSILCIVMHEVPLLFLAPTDKNNLSLCSFTTNIPLPPFPPFG